MTLRIIPAAAAVMLLASTAVAMAQPAPVGPAPYGYGYSGYSGNTVYGPPNWPYPIAPGWRDGGDTILSGVMTVF
jgi:hypothetical protein